MHSYGPYNPPMASEKLPQDLNTFEAMLTLMRHLRAPDGCPWDREQTHQSLKRYLLEECYEVLEAIDNADWKKLAEELGDVLLQVAFHAQIAQEAGEFQAGEMLRQANEKLVRRHPHVFGGARVADAREVERNWERLKRQERGSRSHLAALPRALPALAYAQLLQDRAAKAGFDWEEVSGVVDKVAEEVREVQQAPSQEEREREVGDLLFALVNFARWQGIHAEDALRRANDRFQRRFLKMEELAQQRGLNFAELSLEEKEALWQEAKGLDK